MRKCPMCTQSIMHRPLVSAMESRRSGDVWFVLYKKQWVKAMTPFCLCSRRS